MIKIKKLFCAVRGEKNKKGKALNLSFTVARPGFEPRPTEPTSVVLPLYDRAIRPLSSFSICF